MSDSTSHDDRQHDHGEEDQRSLPVFEEPLDAANQSLADALRASFRVLKFLMAVLIILFLCSGVFIVDQNEKAIVLRFGDPGDKIYGPGVHWAFPEPIDEIVRVPVQEKREVIISSQWLHVPGPDENKKLSEINKNFRDGLDPALEGAVLTAEKGGERGVAHVRWHAIYQVNDLLDYLSEVQNPEELLARVIENASLKAAAGMTAEEITRTKVSLYEERVRTEAREQLDALKSGILLERIDIQSTPPLALRRYFERVTKAENTKQKFIREAQQEATTLLNQVAGVSHAKLEALLDEISVAKAAGDREKEAEITRRFEDILENEATGEAASRIRDARSDYVRIVQDIQADVQQYRELVVEYEQNRELLENRLWQRTLKNILDVEDSTVQYLPEGTPEIWLYVKPDPEQKRKAEMEGLEKRAPTGGQSYRQKKSKPKTSESRD